MDGFLLPLGLKFTGSIPRAPGDSFFKSVLGESWVFFFEPVSSGTTFTSGLKSNSVPQSQCKFNVVLILSLKKLPPIQRLMGDSLVFSFWFTLTLESVLGLDFVSATY